MRKQKQSSSTHDRLDRNDDGLYMCVYGGLEGGKNESNETNPIRTEFDV